MIKTILITALLFIYIPEIICQSLTAEQIYREVSNSVVVVSSLKNEKILKQGSGVIINNEGHIVTNYHVYAGGDKILISHNDKIYQPSGIIGFDIEKDILIIQIKESNISSIKIGEPSSVNIGAKVYAIGSPMGLENTISEGIISGLRQTEGNGRKFIQITASISPGSSGGAVVNENGELIGISTLTAREGQNLNFAIPIEDVLKVNIQPLKENNKDNDFFNKGNNAFDEENYQEAIEYYTFYLIGNPESSEAYKNRGLSKYLLDDYKGAIEDYNMALKINPLDPDNFMLRGHAKTEVDDYNGALQDYDTAIKIDAKYKEILFQSMGDLKSKIGDLLGALKDYDSAIDNNPTDATLYYSRGIVKGKLNDYKSAIDDFNKAIEIKPNFTGAYCERGNIKNSLDDYNGAIEDCNKAIDINPDYPLSYFYRALAKMNLGDEDGGCIDISKSIELGNKSIEDLKNKLCN